MAELLTFQRFNDINLATEIADKLTQLGIYCEIDNQTAPFDVTYANNPLETDIRIKIRNEDFAKADKALDDYYKGLVDTVESDYYLLQFTDQELIEIITKPDEWGRFDYQLAQKLLKDRGKEVQPIIADMLKTQRVADLSKGEPVPNYWLYMGYFSAVLGGLFGIIIGLSVTYSKKTLPDGQRIYVYRQRDRDHGTRIVLLSIIILTLSSLLLLWRKGYFGNQD